MSAPILEFWSLLDSRRDELDSLTQPQSEFRELLLQHVRRIDPILFFEVAPDPSEPREIVFTVGGRAALVPLVEELVAAAPEIPGWQFTALKPAFGFAFTTTHHGTRFEPQAMWFLDLEDAPNPQQISIRVGLPNFTSTTPTQALEAVGIVLQKALGERSFALDVSHFEAVLLPRSPEPAGYIELFELPDVIDEKKRAAV